jgi:NADH-quinone oxidoreductase subunit H
MNILTGVFSYLVFPGFLFTAILGMVASYIDRKVTARVQWRQGPPMLQPVYDFIKLLGKEIIVPEGGSKVTFLMAPLFGLAAVTVVATIVWLALINPSQGFIGDLIVVIYLLTIPAISVIMGGFASNNRLASLGASREMKFILAYELPFVLALTVPVLLTSNIRLGEIVLAQSKSGMAVGTLSGFLALVVSILCIQAKLGLVPFDAAEAEQEIVAGPYVEYSGAPLAVFKLTRWMLLVVLPMFLVVMFMPSQVWWWIVIRYVILLVVIILIRNTNPRLRIDQAVRFFWTRVSALALLAVILALFRI